jgi:hypothetical protein
MEEYITEADDGERVEVVAQACLREWTDGLYDVFSPLTARARKLRMTSVAMIDYDVSRRK